MRTVQRFQNLLVVFIDLSAFIPPQYCWNINESGIKNHNL